MLGFNLSPGSKTMHHPSPHITPSSLAQLEAILDTCIATIAAEKPPEESPITTLSALDKAIACYAKLLSAKQKHHEIEQAHALERERQKTTIAAIPFDEATILRFMQKRHAAQKQDMSK